MSQQPRNRQRPTTPVAIAVNALVRLQVQASALAEIAERTRQQETFNLAVAMYDAAEQAIEKLNGRH